MAVTWIVLGIQSDKTWQVDQESKIFEPVLAAMVPGQRVLSLPFAAKSQAAGNSFGYLHCAAWYQSEKQGLVDFNFVWFPYSSRVSSPTACRL